MVERTNVTIVDPAQPTYEDTGVPVSNALVDQLLWVNCPTKLSKSGSGKCMAHKDTVLMLPGTRTRVRFASPQEPGVFVWHCHILEHEVGAWAVVMETVLCAQCCSRPTICVAPATDSLTATAACR